MKQIRIIFLLILLLPTITFAQEKFRVMFYNVENLFDTEKDPHKNDNEFLPTSKKHWDKKKYNQKLTNIAKVISSAGEWDIPALVGLCEVENERVMKDLTQYSPLKSQSYKFVITDSEDARGIDVALLYQPDQFKLISYCSYKIPFKSKQKTSRDILYVSGKIKSGDTLDIFVCHYPSRRGGEKSSEPDRIRASEVLRQKTDSLYMLRKQSNIIIMGDFNDEPSNISIYNTLSAKPYNNKLSKDSKQLELYNLFYHFEKKEMKGSHKYQGHWGMLDQVIVSRRLLERSSSFRITNESPKIYDPEFLLTEDKSHGGKRPKRTFFGMQYEAGFSDHLPVITDFYVYLKN